MRILALDEKQAANNAATVARMQAAKPVAVFQVGDTVKSNDDFAESFIKKLLGGDGTGVLLVVRNTGDATIRYNGDVCSRYVNLRHCELVSRGGK